MAIEKQFRTNGTMENDKILIIGGAGYIGSVLCRELLNAGYSVRVLDNLIYGQEGIEGLFENDRFELIEADMRSIEAIMEGIKGVDTVIHLGALVGEPASEIDPQTTLEINLHAVRLAASICKYHQVSRFLFASTCSVYGQSHSPNDYLTESSDLNPVSLYAQTKAEAEKSLLAMEGEDFSPTICRLATVYGLSPRMRFDLVVNILVAKAHNEGTIPIYGGEQYRPNVHVSDVSRAFIYFLEAPVQKVRGEIFNIGSNEQNYRIREVGEIVQSYFSDIEIDIQPEKSDERTYKVDFSKIKDRLGFKPKYTITDCCRNIESAFQMRRFTDYTDNRYNNYETLDQSEVVSGQV